jgi:chromosome segregation ATPase
LDKVRKLMLVAKEFSSHKPLAYLVMNFCIDCTLMNPFVRAEGMRSLLFPGYDDVSSLEQAWAVLQSLPTPAEPNASVGGEEAGGLQDNVQSNNDEAPVTDTGKDNAAKSQRAIATVAIRSRRNALLCAAIWRVQQGQMAFLEMVRSLRATLFSLKKRPESLDDELLEALACISDKDAEPMSLLLEWNNRQQTEAANRLADMNRRVGALDDEVRDLKERLALALAQAATLETQLTDERAGGQALQTALSVAKTHGQADLEGLRALALNTLRDAVSQLDVVSEALKREPPKVFSALDKVDAVMDRLKATNEKLENT